MPGAVLRRPLRLWAVIGRCAVPRDATGGWISWRPCGRAPVEPQLTSSASIPYSLPQRLLRRRITDECFIAAAQASADQVGPELRAKGMLFPASQNILETEVTT